MGAEENPYKKRAREEEDDDDDNASKRSFKSTAHYKVSDDEAKDPTYLPDSDDEDLKQDNQSNHVVKWVNKALEVKDAFKAYNKYSF